MGLWEPSVSYFKSCSPEYLSKDTLVTLFFLVECTSWADILTTLPNSGIYTPARLKLFPSSVCWCDCSIPLKYIHPCTGCLVMYYSWKLYCPCQLLFLPLSAVNEELLCKCEGFTNFRHSPALYPVAHAWTTPPPRGSSSWWCSRRPARSCCLGWLITRCGVVI